MSIETVLQEMDKRIKALEKKVERQNGRISPINYGDIIGTAMGFVYLRGFWPLNSAFETGNWVDYSGQGRHLSVGVQPAATVQASNLITYTFNGTTHYMYRADEAGLDIGSSITLGCWLKVISESGAQSGIIGKWNTSGNQRSYGILENAGGGIDFLLSSNGTAEFGFTGIDSQVGKWVFTAMRCVGNTEFSIFRNDVSQATTTSVPTSFFNSTAQFEVGRANQAGTYSNIQIALPFLCYGYNGVASLYPWYHLTRPLFGV